MSEQLIFDQQGGIARLTLNRPEAGNSLTLELAGELLGAAIRCDQDPSIRCVVLTGAGRMFCVGGDIGEFSAHSDRVGAYLSRLAGIMNLVAGRLTRMAKPLLVLVNGPAAGAGLSLALAGDVVLAAREAHFTSAYTAIGLVPDCGLTWLLPRVVGMRRAQEMIVTNRRIGPEEAERIGLVTRIADDLQADGQAAAEALATAPPAAIGASRGLLLDSFSSPFELQLEREARAIAAAGAGPEGREGIAAFLAKRTPDFRGE